MQVLVENTSQLGRQVKISVPGAKVNEQIKKKLNELSTQVRLNGFSPGRAIPPHILQKKFGESIRTQVIEDVINESLQETFKEKALEPVKAPEVKEVNFDLDLEFTAIFDVYPEINLADLSQVEIEKKIPAVLEEEVTQFITTLQKEFAPWEKVERPIQKEDKVTVDFGRLLKEEGAVREDQQNMDMIIADGAVPGLNEALLGKQVGEQLELALRYPQDWTEAAVAGKEMTLWVNIHAVAEKKIRSVEDVARMLQLGEMSEADFKQDVQKTMEADIESFSHHEMEEKLMNILLEKNSFELPKALVEHEKQTILESKKSIAESDLQAKAERQVKLTLLLNAVIEKYELKADQEVVLKRLHSMVQQSYEPLNKAKAKKLFSYIERKMLLEQAMDTLLKECKVIEKPVSFDTVRAAKKEHRHG